MKQQVVLLLLWTVLGITAAYVIAVFLLCEPSCSDTCTKYLYCSEVQKLSQFYAVNLRGHLFAAFLALGGFLLSLKTFIVVTMKENVYDNIDYKEDFEEKLKLNPELKRYGPLQELSDYLYYAILASIISALLQMTLGLYPYWVPALIAISSAVFAMVLLISCLVLIKRNSDVWFEHLHNPKIRKPKGGS